MSDKSFRVLLDLTDLKIDSLKYVWINVSPQELLTIADFKSSILRKINLDGANIKLYVRKGLLLDSETTTILREDDTIKVHYANQLVSEGNTLEKFVKENRKSSRKRIHAECISESSINCNEFSKVGEIFENRNNQDEINTKHKKKKSKQLHSLEPENSCTQSIVLETNNLQKLETHKKKDKKLKTSEKNRTDLQICEFFSFNDSECTVLGNESSQNTCLEINDFSKTDLSKDMSPVDNVSLEIENKSRDQSSVKMISFGDSNALNNTSSKKKRKRHRRKKANKTASDIADNANNQSNFKSFVYEVNKNFQGKHVTYTSPSKEEVINIDCDDSFKDDKNINAETFVFNGSLINSSVESSYHHPKVSTPAQSNKIENPNLCLSGMQTTTINSPVEIYKKHLGLTPTNYIPNNSLNSSYTKSLSKQSEEFKTKEKSSQKAYSELPPLNARPDVGTHIAYKVLELDEHYSPVISDYREGIVKSVNFETEEIEIELLKHVIKPGRTGKFENLCEGEIPHPEIKTYDTVRWSSLVEPKLLLC